MSCLKYKLFNLILYFNCFPKNKTEHHLRILYLIKQLQREMYYVVKNTPVSKMRVKCFIELKEQPTKLLTYVTISNNTLYMDNFAYRSTLKRLTKQSVKWK